MGGSSLGRPSPGRSSLGRSAESRPWASEGTGVRNTSPGWHSFERGSNGASVAGRSGAAGLTARTGSIATSRTAIADGQFHSFAAGHSVAGSMAASINHPAGAAFAGRGNFVNGAWRGGGLIFRNGWGGWGWGCCGWGWGWGWGFGWGWGWGFGWDPFWYAPPYWYAPNWYDFPDGDGY